MMHEPTERPADITPEDWLVLHSLEQAWQFLSEVEQGPTGLYGRALLGRLRSLRSRGLVTYREPDHDVYATGHWALTKEADKIVWDVDDEYSSLSKPGF